MAIPTNMTLTQLLSIALQNLSVLDSGGSPSAQQLTDALAIANALIDNKSSDRLMAESVTITSKALSANVRTYTIGTGGSINIVRPTEITAASFYDRQAVAGLGNIFVSPTPLGGTLELITWAAMTQFADTTTAITIQPAYSRWLMLAFTMEIAPQYAAAQVPSTLAQDIADATANLRNLNASLLGPEPPAGQVSSNVTGQPVAIPGVR